MWQNISKPVSCLWPRNSERSLEKQENTGVTFTASVQALKAETSYCHWRNEPSAVIRRQEKVAWWISKADVSSTSICMVLNAFSHNSQTCKNTHTLTVYPSKERGLLMSTSSTVNGDNWALNHESRARETLWL